MKIGLGISIFDPVRAGGIESAYKVTVKTDNTGTSADDQVILNAVGDYTVEVYQSNSLVDTITGLSGNQTITLPGAGTFDLRIIPVGATPFNQITWFGSGDEGKIIKVLAMGSDVAWNDFNSSYRDCTNLTSFISGQTNTSNVTSMFAMFFDCSSLTSVDASGFDTSNVTNMQSMFSNCLLLDSLDISGFDTSSVTSMSFMFDDCQSLASLDVSGFNTSSVEFMISMFSRCSSLASLNLVNFDTSNVTRMDEMFKDCSLLTSFDPSGFVIENVTNLNIFARNTNMGTTVYDQLLINWEAQLVNDNLSPHFGNAQYTSGGAAETARTALINDHSWTISDGGAA